LVTASLKLISFAGGTVWINFTNILSQAGQNNSICAIGAPFCFVAAVVGM
jgi:hypothetical protein